MKKAAISLCALLALSLLTACATKAPSSSSNSLSPAPSSTVSPAASDTASAPQDETLTFTDDLGREVTVPMQPQRAAHSYEEHEAIIRGLALHDPELAAKQTDIHFHISQRSLQNKLRKYLKTP